MRSDFLHKKVLYLKFQGEKLFCDTGELPPIPPVTGEQLTPKFYEKGVTDRNSNSLTLIAFKEFQSMLPKTLRLRIHNFPVLVLHAYQFLWVTNVWRNFSFPLIILSFSFMNETDISLTSKLVYDLRNCQIVQDNYEFFRCIILTVP